MDPLPRHSALDAKLAREGASSATLQVYADWLLQREHPLADFIIDAIAAESGDRAAQARTTERRFSVTDPERFPSTIFRWCAGVVTGIEQGVRDNRSSSAVPALHAEPALQLLTEARVHLGPADHGREALDALEGAPPSLGRVEIADSRAPEQAERVDLGHLAQPHLADLRVRVGAITSLPPHLDGVRRLELRASVLSCALRPLRNLEVLHLYSALGESAMRTLIEGAPRLSVLGLHHPGSLRELLDALSGIALPASLRELAVSLPAATQSDLDAIARFAPRVETIRLPWVQLPSPLRPPFVATPAPDQPIYVV